MTQNERPQASQSEAYHGGLDPRELAFYGIDPNRVIDFSSNILPHGPSPKVIEAIASACIARYPDRESDELRHVISQHYGVQLERLLIGNGCSELIHWVAMSLLSPGNTALVVGPTFSEYARATRLAGAMAEECDSSSDDGFAVPCSAIEARLDQRAVQLVWICNPNNPTAQVIPTARIVAWLERYPETWFVIDESYIEFSDTAQSLLDRTHANLIVLRSLTKSFAIPGVRVGFAAVAPRAYETLCAHRVPWNVSSVAQAAAIAALGDTAYYGESMADLRDAKQELLNGLKSAGLEVIAGDANFFLIRSADKKSLRQQLLRQGMVVRDCTSFGLPGWIRIATLDRRCNRQLIDAFTGGNADADMTETADERPASADQHTFGFAEPFRDQLFELFRKRRDVRRFKTDPLPDGAVRRWIDAACLAPSVGLSQPWRFVSIQSPGRRDSVYHEFLSQNDLAAERYDDESIGAKYRTLKLAGLKEAPEHLAVFVEPDPSQGRGLGRATMPETVVYSVVAAIQNLWLAARAEGVGVGWVSILRPERIATLLDVPETWQLVAYLCIGWPEVDEDDVPELEHLGWEKRIETKSLWLQR